MPLRLQSAREYGDDMRKRLKKIFAWGLVGLVALIASGLLLADHLTPQATGAPSWTLPLERDATAIDRELMPLLDRNPGMSGVILVPDGLDAFASRAISARQAGRSLDVQYYIWKDDLAGHLLLNELWQAAERGVRVRLLLDDINAGGKDAPLLVLDGHPNIEVRLYNPFRNRGGIARLLEMLQRGFSLNHRMHNKAWIADGRVAIVGGRNIGLEYFSASEASNFHDLDLLLFGPEVEQASRIFDAFWNSEAVVPLSDLGKLGLDDIRATVDDIAGEARSVAARRYMERVEGSPSVRAYLERSLEPHWSARTRIVSDPPVKRRGDDGSQWLVGRIDAALRGAERAALLVSPYFVPGEETSAVLTGLAGAGVHVGVVTNSLAANDVVAVHGGYAKYRRDLLAGGVHLYELRPQAAATGDGDGSGPANVRPRAGAAGSSGASLHTKAFLVDGRRGFIGSYNLDPRSAWLNTEMGVFFDDPGLAAELRDEYLHLAGPALSWKVMLDDGGDLAWLDAAAEPPRLLDTEPDATRWRRFQALVFRWLPLESQL